LIEELIFRGYIQTRLVGFFKHKITGIILTGILFALMHIPFQIAVSNMSFLEFIKINYPHLLLTFFYHMIFSLLYYKFNNIAAPTIFHFFLNISYSLFS
jgi:membrane protease YdiL (CAAX protease family)